jgi:perosamine synthetase
MDLELLEKYLVENITLKETESGVFSFHNSTQKRVKAIMPVHVLGNIGNVDRLIEISKKYHLDIIEDSTEALGSYFKGKHAGTFGKFGVFSFNGNKTITTGGGGVIVTDDQALAKRLKHLSTTARVPHPYEFDHDAVGYNYRMPNINAALGLAQMEQLPGLIAGQRDLFELYDKAFAGSPFGDVRQEPAGTKSNYWLQAISLPEGLKNRKDGLIRGCVDAGVSVRPMWRPLNRLTPYASHPSAPTPVTEDLYNRVICLPSSVFLANRDR